MIPTTTAQVSSPPRPKKRFSFRRVVQSLLPSTDKKKRKDSALPVVMQREDGNSSSALVFERQYLSQEEEEGGNPYEPRPPPRPPPPQSPPPQILTGPVPRRPSPTSNQPSPPQIDPTLTSFALQTSLASLSPLESRILSLLLQTSRCSHFRPVLEPNTSVLLTQPSDTAAIQQVLDLVKELPEREKAALERGLKGHLLQSQQFVLGVLLWNVEVTVRGRAAGGGEGDVRLEVEEGWDRPTSGEMFGPWKREWDHL